MTIEKLTDDERAVICGAPSLATLGDAGAKAISIIDQLTEALAAADEQRRLQAAKLARLEATEARVRELEAARAAELEARGKYGFATAEQLAAANALLARPAAPKRVTLGKVLGMPQELPQPAAPTDHDRAVLEAAAAIHPRALNRPLQYVDDWQEFADAELARREAKR